MSWILERLRNSRLSAVKTQIEAGQEVDWAKVRRLQTLDLVTDGQSALADAIEREREFDERIEQLLTNQ